MEENNDQIMERTFYVKCTRQQLIELGDWMNDHGIFFQKVQTKSEDEKEADGSLRP